MQPVHQRECMQIRKMTTLLLLLEILIVSSVLRCSDAATLTKVLLRNAADEVSPDTESETPVSRSIASYIRLDARLVLATFIVHYVTSYISIISSYTDD